MSGNGPEGPTVDVVLVAAGGHIGAPNVTAVARDAFDWLDETLEG